MPTTTYSEAGRIAAAHWKERSRRVQDPSERATCLLMSGLSLPLVTWLEQHQPVLTAEQFFDIFNNVAAELMAEVLRNLLPPGYVIDLGIAAEEYRKALETKLSGPSDIVAIAEALDCGKA